MLELRCRSCTCHFRAPASAPYEDVLDQMIDEAPWFGLAEGKTFEDMIFTALATRGAIRCPDCSEDIVVLTRTIERVDQQQITRMSQAPVGQV